MILIFHLSGESFRNYEGRWQRLFFNLLIYIQGVSITRTHYSNRLLMHFYWDTLYILHMHHTKHKSKHGTCDKKILTPTPVCSNFSFSAIFLVPKQLEIIILHPSSFIFHLSSFIIIHSSFIIIHSSFIHPSFISWLLSFSACSECIPNGGTKKYHNTL